MTAEEIPHSLKDAIGLPCNCDDAYKSRKLSAPDCPKCNYQDTIEIDVMAWCLLQIEKDRERVKEYISELSIDYYIDLDRVNIQLD